MKFGLIGMPLGHSFSADFFNRKFRIEGIDAHYSLYPLPTIEDFSELLKIGGIKGLNVTIPYKEKIIPFLTDIDPIAKAIGAVNVIKISETTRELKGFNTDAIGFRNSLSPLLGPHVKNALVLGTGGASKAVCYVLKQLGISVTLVSRKASENAIDYSLVTPEIISSTPLIVNTTPLGTWPNVNEAPLLQYEYLTPDHILFDLVYNPEITEFMRQGLMRGAKVKNGLEMLHGQALAAWDIWNS